MMFSKGELEMIGFVEIMVLINLTVVRVLIGQGTDTPQKV